MHLLRCITGDSGSLNSSAISNGLVGVGTLVGFLAIEEVRNELYDMGHMCQTTNKNELVHVGLVDFKAIRDLLDEFEGTMGEILVKLLKTRSEEHTSELQSPA